MDDVTLLQNTRRNLLEKLYEYSKNPRVSYNVEGQSLNYAEYLKMLVEGIKAANELILLFQPFEIRSVFG